LAYPVSYLLYLVHFHMDHDYFECHEILEEYWKNETKQKRDSVWVLLIQIAVACYHHRRGNFKGAGKLLLKAQTRLKNNRNELIQLGIDADQLSYLLLSRYQDISSQKEFRPFALPLNNFDVKNQYIQLAQQFCISNWNDIRDREYIIHRHSLRDRSSIIANRLKSLDKRRHSAAARWKK
jgi:predicted metal-dependent hydrolase